MLLHAPVFFFLSFCLVFVYRLNVIFSPEEKNKKTMPCVIWRLLVTKIRHLSYLISCYKFKQLLKLFIKIFGQFWESCCFFHFVSNDKIPFYHLIWNLLLYSISFDFAFAFDFSLSVPTMVDLVSFNADSHVLTTLPILTVVFLCGRHYFLSFLSVTQT